MFLAVDWSRARSGGVASRQTEEVAVAIRRFHSSSAPVGRGTTFRTGLHLVGANARVEDSSSQRAAAFADEYHMVDTVGMTSVQIMLKMMLARCLTQQSNARFQAEMSDRAALQSEKVSLVEEFTRRLHHEISS